MRVRCYTDDPISSPERCVSIEFILILDMNNKVVIINFTCFTILDPLIHENLMWKCGKSRNISLFAHTHTLFLSRHFWVSVWQSLFRLHLFCFLLCFSIVYLLNFKDLWMVFFSFVWFVCDCMKKIRRKKFNKQKTHQLVI